MSYDASIEHIGDAVAADMRGRSWRDDPRCPSFDELALLRLPFFDFEGREQRGELVVARELADEIVWAFSRLHAERFPIASMTRIDAFEADDEASMAANNCSCFNFRVIAGTERLSLHARGAAIDINPVQNPWVRGDDVRPGAGREYLDRARARPGMILGNGPVVSAFADVGWVWGGDWESTQDYHHFERIGDGG